MGFTSLSRDDLSLHSWVPQAFPLRPKPASTYMLEGRDQDTEDTKPRAASKVLAGPEPAGCRLSPSATGWLPSGPRYQHSSAAVRLELLLAILSRKRAPFPAPSPFSLLYAYLLRSAPPSLPRLPGGIVPLVDLQGLENGSAHAHSFRGPSGKKLAGRGWRKAVAPRLGERAAAALGGAEVQGWWPGCCGACELLQSCALLWRGGAG